MELGKFGNQHQTLSRSDLCKPGGSPGAGAGDPANDSPRPNRKSRRRCGSGCIFLHRARTTG